VETLMIRYVRCGYLPSVLNALLTPPDSKTHSHKTTLTIPSPITQKPPTSITPTTTPLSISERRADTSQPKTHNRRTTNRPFTNHSKASNPIHNHIHNPDPNPPPSSPSLPGERSPEMLRHPRTQLQAYPGLSLPNRIRPGLPRGQHSVETRRLADR
jgi:hypothetical protein